MNARQQYRYYILDAFAAGTVSATDPTKHCSLFINLPASKPDRETLFVELIDLYENTLGYIKTTRINGHLRYTLSDTGDRERKRLEKKYKSVYADALNESHELVLEDSFDIIIPEESQILSPILSGIYHFRISGLSLVYTCERFESSVFQICSRYRHAVRLIEQYRLRSTQMLQTDWVELLNDHSYFVTVSTSNYSTARPPDLFTFMLTGIRRLPSGTPPCLFLSW